LGFPEGYDSTSEGVTFKAYHFIKNAQGEITDVEEIDCVVTKYGLILTCDSFSPFTIAAVKSTEGTTDTADAAKTVILSSGNGGTISGTDGNVVTLKKGESTTLTVQADDKYQIESISVGDKLQTITNTDKETLTISYDDLKNATEIIDAKFVAKTVVEKEEERNEVTIIPATSETTKDPEDNTETKPGESEDNSSTEQEKTDISAMTATLSKTSVTYNGKAQTPTVTVEGLTEEKDFTVTYENNKNAGEATVTVTGIGDYEGTITTTFTIQKAQIGSVSAISAKTYTGKAIKPKVKVSKGTYKVSYKNNKNVGTATVTVTGTKNYTGTKKVSFKINPKGTSIKSLTKAKKAFTVKWKKQATQTTGYQIRYATKKSMSKAKTVTVGKNSMISKKISKLKSKTTYYVQIRTYKKIGKKTYYSSWSKAKTVKTK
jgi:hypothetical protein